MRYRQTERKRVGEMEGHPERSQHMGVLHCYTRSLSEDGIQLRSKEIRDGGR